MWNVVHTAWRAIVLFVVCTAVVPIVVTATVLAGFIFLPLPASMPEPKLIMQTSRISRVLDSQGNEIAVFRLFDQSIPVAEHEIPQHLKQAVVAAEDRSFYRHGGVDIRGSTRALVRDLQGGAVTQGGSTITQQYVKNAYTGRQRTIFRKVQEAILASQLDRKLEKSEILHRYLSTIFLGEGAYGVAAAAKVYFRKHVSELTVSEAATLAGIIPAPSRYSPRNNLDAAEMKRRVVLGAMRHQGYLTEEAYQAALRSVLTRSPTPLDPATATVVYPPERVETRYPYFVDYVRRYLVNRYGEDLVYRGGLTIQTTLDPDLQAKAEKAAAATLAGTRAITGPDGRPNHLFLSLVAVEPGSGYVKALVGGRDFDETQVNVALGDCPTQPTDPAMVRTVEVEASCWSEKAPVEGGGSGRQPGSTFKVFTLAAAFEKGIPPTRAYSGGSPFRVPGCSGSKCLIHNAGDGQGGGAMSLAAATAGSVNTVFARLGLDVGNKSIAEMAKKLGVTSAWYSPRDQGASYTLGTQEVSPLDMAAAYSVFANRGMRAPATPVVKVVDADGNVLEDNLQPKAKRVVDEPVADTVNQVLQGVLTGGTARGKGIDRPAAGKTGSTQENNDAWFVGYTPDLSVAVSMGYDRRAPLKRIKGVSTVYGGTLPAQTWQGFMKEALAGVPVTQFTDPAPIKRIQDQIERQRRGGIDPGPQRRIAGTDDGGPYEIGPGRPSAPMPATTAPPTTRRRATTTTSTTSPIVTLPGP